MEALKVMDLDEAEWDAEEISFCTTGSSTHTAAVTELDEEEWDAEEISFCTTGSSTHTAAVTDES